MDVQKPNIEPPGDVDPANYLNIYEREAVLKLRNLYAPDGTRGRLCGPVPIGPIAALEPLRIESNVHCWTTFKAMASGGFKIEFGTDHVYWGGDSNCHSAQDAVAVRDWFERFIGLTVISTP